MKLDELIKYAFENNIKNKRYRSNNGKKVMFFGNGSLASTYWNIGKEDLFSVEVEEEITEDTEFDELYTMMKFKNVYRHDAKTINEVKECFKFSGEFELLHQIYAMIDGKLELIYEEDNNGEE